jgi:hypothetical protein
MKREAILSISIRPWAGLAFPLGHKRGRYPVMRKPVGATGRTIEMLIDIEAFLEAWENGYSRFP